MVKGEQSQTGNTLGRDGKAERKEARKNPRLPHLQVTVFIRDLLRSVSEGAKCQESFWKEHATRVTFARFKIDSKTFREIEPKLRIFLVIYCEYYVCLNFIKKFLSFY